jgi:hypothetical protein
MSKGKGYLLPAGEAYTDELDCVIVYYPAKDEYRRALRGSLDYLGTWVAWERDSAKRGKDAARAWKAANELTRECFDMACLENLVSDVAAIRGMLAALDPCCGQNLTINPGPPPTTDIEPGVGDPPATYGETEVEDWDEWLSYLCYNASAYVDQMIETAHQMNGAMSVSALSLGLIASVLALLSFTGIGLPVSFALASTVLFGLIGAGAGIFATTAEDLEAVRDELICGVFNGDFASVVESTLGSASLDWLLLYSHIPYDSALAVLYNGGANGEYLPAQTSDDCDCDTGGDSILFTFDSNNESWDIGNGFAYDSNRDLMSGQISSGDRWTSVTAVELRSRLSLPPLTPLQLVSIDAHVTGWAMACSFELKAFVYDGSTQHETATQVYSGSGSPGPTIHMTFNTPFSGSFEYVGLYAVRICGGGNQFCFLDDITVTVTSG